MTRPAIDQVVFDNEKGLRVVACSTEDHVAVDRWSYRLERFNRLESFDDIAPPRHALSYFRMGPEEAAVLYRWREQGASPGRNPSRALVGHPDVLTVPVALGLARWSDWKSAPRTGLLQTLDPTLVTEFARKSEDEHRAWAQQDPESVTRALAALIENPTMPMSIIGMASDTAVSLLWALHAIGKPHADWLESTYNIVREWTFSTYEHDHRVSAGELPEIVFLPARPRAQGEIRRAVVDLDPRAPTMVSPGARSDAKMMVDAFLSGKEPLTAGARATGADPASDVRATGSPAEGALRGELVQPGNVAYRGEGAQRGELPPRGGTTVRAGGGTGYSAPAGDGYARDGTGGGRDRTPPVDQRGGGGRPEPGAPPNGSPSGGSQLPAGRPGRQTAGALPWSPSARREADIVQRLLTAADGDVFALVLRTLGPEYASPEARDRLRQALRPEVVDELAAVLLARTDRDEGIGLARELLDVVLGSGLDDMRRPDGLDFVGDLIEHCRSPWFVRELLTVTRSRLGISKALTTAVTNRLLVAEGLEPLDRLPEQRQKIRRGGRSFLRRPLRGGAQRALWISVMALAGLVLGLTFWLGYSTGSAPASASPTDPGGTTVPATPTGAGTGGTTGAGPGGGGTSGTGTGTDGTNGAGIGPGGTGAGSGAGVNGTGTGATVGGTGTGANGAGLGTGTGATGAGGGGAARNLRGESQ